MKAYADLAGMPEDDRIKVIAETAASGEVVGFVVEYEAKADRYIRKLEKYPLVKVTHRGPGPVTGTILVRVSAKGN
ncbi:MAG: hypothetical protein Q8O42_09670 [Acidobacteriota bacterium]|nr:hypothetical protein [Acidobacteriota bacterium]